VSFLAAAFFAAADNGVDVPFTLRLRAGFLAGMAAFNHNNAFIINDTNSD
jgi:hypothetical protein